MTPRAKKIIRVIGDLTTRRREVAALVGLNYSCPDIAAELGMKPRTVHSHLQWIAAKIDAPDISSDLPAYRRVRAWVNSKHAA